jgi:hypothetical protein
VNLPTVRKMLLMRAPKNSNGNGLPCTNNAYHYFFAHFVKCVVGLIKFNRGWNTGNLYKLVTPSDEALGLLLLENNEERWIAEHARGGTETMHQQVENEPVPDLPLSKYTSNGKKESRGYTKKNQGWKEAGVVRFNALVKNVIYDRKVNGGIEWQEAFREYVKRVVIKDFSECDESNNERSNGAFNGTLPVRVRAYCDLLESDDDANDDDENEVQLVERV